MDISRGQFNFMAAARAYGIEPENAIIPL